LYASALSQKGEVLELLPPEMVTDEVEIEGQVCSIPVYVNNKMLSFVVTDEI